MAQKLGISTLNQIADNWAGGRRHPWDWAIGNWTSFLGGRNQGHLNDPSKSKGVGSQFRLQVLARHHRCMMLCRYFYFRLAAVFFGGVRALFATRVWDVPTLKSGPFYRRGVCVSSSLMFGVRGTRQRRQFLGLSRSMRSRHG